MDKLTKEQAIVLSGFTGIVCCKFDLMHKDVEKRLNRPVFTHEFGNEIFVVIVRELYRGDFMKLAYTDE